MPLLFVVTAIAEIAGCYLPYLWLRKGGPVWLLMPGVASLLLFAWLLTLHPSGAGRNYIAYGGVYVGVALLWAWLVEGEQLVATDWIGVSLCLLGMLVLYYGRGWSAV